MMKSITANQATISGLIAFLVSTVAPTQAVAQSGAVTSQAVHIKKINDDQYQAALVTISYEEDKAGVLTYPTIIPYDWNSIVSFSPSKLSPAPAATQIPPVVAT